MSANTEDTRIALVKGALKEAKERQAKAKEAMSDANRSVWALENQLAELEGRA